MTEAQIWLDNTIPLSQRANQRKLYIFPNTYQNDPEHQQLYQNVVNCYYLPVAESLTGSLDLSNFPNLRELIINHQFINQLILTNCQQLRKLDADNNLLREVIWPLYAPNLKNIYLNDNNFWSQDLSVFARFPRLKCLFLGTYDEARIRGNVYNRWNGSLARISNLKLEELDINATDISEGLLNLSTDRLFHFTFGNCGRAGPGVDNLKDTLANFVELEEGETMESWAVEGTFSTEDSLENSEYKVSEIRRWQREQRQQQGNQSAQIQVSPNHRSN